MNSSILIDNKPKRSFGIQITNHQVKNNSLVARKKLISRQKSNKHLKHIKKSRQHSPQKIQQNNTAMEIQQNPISKYEDPTYEYKSEILQHLFSLEQKIVQNFFNFFDIQTDINEHMRSVLLNWLVQVHLKYKLMPQTLFMTINIIDQYLSQNVVHRTKLQLLGITALWIAAKYQQIYQVPKIHNLVFICDSAYNKQQILQMQSQILLKLNFNLLKNNSFHFLQLFKQFSDLDEKDYFFARYLIQISLLQFKMKKYSTRCVAAASIFFIKKIRRKVPSWNNILQQKTGFTEAQIRQCARQICSSLQDVDQNQRFESLKRKFSALQYKQIGKIKIGQKSNKQ